MTRVWPGRSFKDELRARREELIPEHILLDDILSAINYGINLCDYYDDDDDSDEDSQEDAIKRSHTHDDIDHLGNRRVRCAGELFCRTSCAWASPEWSVW